MRFPAAAVPPNTGGELTLAEGGWARTFFFVDAGTPCGVRNVYPAVAWKRTVDSIGSDQNDEELFPRKFYVFT